MLIDGEKFACEACVRGHRVSNCQHSDRPLQHINKKGRPVSQCPNCRGLRKSRSSHVKCECGDKPHNKDQCRDGERSADQPCSCNREKRCSCAIQRELLGPINEIPKRGIKRPRSSTETEKDKARPRGLSATNSDPNLQVFKKHKPAYHRYSHSGQESSTYHGRPQSQHASAGYSPISMEGMMAQNGAFFMGRRPQSLQAFSPYSTESMDSLSSLPYDLHRPMLHTVPSYSSDSVETFSTLPRDNLPYDIQRPRSIHGQAPFAQKFDGFSQMREGTPHFYADGVALEERRVRSAHTSPGPAPAGKLERYANHYPHLEIPSYTQNPGNITSSPVGDDYGQQRYSNIEYVSPTEGPGSVSGEPPNMPVADWTPLDLPLNNPGAFTTSAAQSHASSYTSFDPGLLAQQPGLTDASSGDVSEADDYAQHASVASPSAAATSPFVQAAAAPYGVSAAGDPYVDLSQSAAMDMAGQVHGLPAEPYLHRATGSPVDHQGDYALPAKAEADPYSHPSHPMGVPADMAHTVTPQPTSDPSWVDTGAHHNGGTNAYVVATSAQPTGDSLWAASQVDDSTGHLSPHHSQPTNDPSWAAQYGPTDAEAVKLSPRLVAAAAARMQAAAHDSASPDPSPTSRNQSPYAAALQPTSDPTWAANAAVAAAHDPVGTPQSQPPPQPSPSPVNAAVHSRHDSPHPHVAPTSDPTWIAVSQGLDMASVASAVAMQQRQATPPSTAHADGSQKLGQTPQRAWSPAAAAAYAEQQQQQARFSAGSTTPGGSNHAQYPYDA